MIVRSAASRSARIAPAANFTGAVFQDPLASADAPIKDERDHSDIRAWRANGMAHA